MHFEVVEDGYEFFADRQLVTIFSAPNYCGEFDNAGAMMSVDETLMCSFQILKPADKKPRYNSGEAALPKLGNLPTCVKVCKSPLKCKICYVIFIVKDKMEERSFLVAFLVS
ncbi:hypothetical protein SAY86_002433 [Trapa natans]|uniref:protein-serine/threonine phosphatase n=1 Tax=Trapa natans TaxID=22666 RepID=A0AAN7LK85_TRANT|nr:hypothetical protein SAY86_002433 [Trapa natans]